MLHREPDCLAPDGAPTRPIHAVGPAGLPALLAALPPAQARFLETAGFAAKEGAVCLLPGPDGVAGAAFGLGADPAPLAFGRLPWALPEGDWALAPGEYDPARAVLGFCLGAYRFDRFKDRRPGDRAPARLAAPAGCEAALRAARATWFARDLVNLPANHLGPAELADAAQALAERFGAEYERTEGAALAAAYPAVAAVGAGSDRPPVVATLRWRGSGAGTGAKLVSVCGKGVCFDTGGYDIKPGSAMIRMKKDMGGAAIALGLAQMVMAADLPVRLAVRIGCAENSVSGRAMRPSDVIATRRGLSVEVGNTDCEGRLILADLLAEAADEAPDLLIDFATLTGAARGALGPDLPALFCDDAWAGDWIAAAAESDDPVWRLPLWPRYAGWLDSPVAALNNMPNNPMAGAITAALFLQRFLRRPDAGNGSDGAGGGMRWAHLDTYAWNDADLPGQPKGGEAQSMRAAFAVIARAAR